MTVTDSPNVSAALTALRRQTADLRIAIVHDWLAVRGGAEKVLDALVSAFPHARVFSLVDFMPENLRGELAGREVTTSFLQRMPLARRFYRHYLPLMPLAVEQLDVSDFDLVISSSHAVAKGVTTHHDQVHVCYCHTPMRYAWDMKERYLRDAGFRFPPQEWLVRYSLHRLRQWDHFTASQVDHFAANSRNVARRIARYYRRDAAVIYPPVDVIRLGLNSRPREDFYVTASRMVAYKRQDLIIEAFRQMPNRRLVVAGDGPERKRLEALASGAPNIELVGYQTDARLQELLTTARAFVFAADEDFGIVPIEAQACGTPVIAYGHGGALETVVSPDNDSEGAATGIFFAQQTRDSLISAVNTFECHRFTPEACWNNAQRFSHDAFWQGLHQLMHQTGLTPGS